MSARTSNMKKSAHSFKSRLDQLGCPYTEGVEESWITELIFRPGEQRIRLLQWVFSKLDSTIHDLLDTQYASVDMKMDSRIQRLLFVASSLGLCKPDDAELIRGTAPANKQKAFIDQLLDIVCIIDAAEDPFSDSNDLKDQFGQDCLFADTLFSEISLDAMYVEKPKIFPPDMMMALDQMRERKGYTEKDKILVPDGSRLKEMADQLTKDLQKQNNVLDQLVKKYDYPYKEEATEQKVMRTLKLVLSELSQLVVGFSYCFENEMRPWCNKSAPRITEIGIAFRRVHNMLQQFTALLKAFSSIRTSYSHMTTDIHEGITKVASAVNASKVPGLLAANISQAALESFQDCLEVLDESLQRQEQSLALHSTINTYNASVVRVSQP